MAGNWLVLETSGRVGKVGLARNGTVVRSRSLDNSRRHARDLALTIDALLAAESLRPADLTGIVAGRGPGSYTGLRVGLISAKALAYATGCELRAVDTFAAIAEQLPPDARWAWIIADALQGQVYSQRFVRSDQGWTASTALAIEPFIAWADKVGAGEYLSGPGVAVHHDQLPTAGSVAPEFDREPRVESVFAAGMKVKPLAREEMFALEPLYLRASSAEEKAKGK